MSKAILIYGNPADGFRFVGPFDTKDAAVEYLRTEPSSNVNWWVTELDAPAEVMTFEPPGSVQ